MRRTRVFVWTLLGCGMTAFGCSSTASHDVTSTAERLGTSRQALVGANKVCQLIGDVDYQTHAQVKGLTKTSYGLPGVDLGYPVHDTNRNKVWFLFGDVFPSGADLQHTAPDPLAFTNASLPGDNCPSLSVVSDSFGTFRRLSLFGFPDLGGFQVPTGGTFDAPGDRIIAGFMMPQNNEPAVSYLAQSFPSSNPTQFFAFVDGSGPIPGDPAHFLIVAPSIVKAASLPNAVTLPGSSADALLVFGTGVPYRESAVYAAAVRLDQIGTRSSWRYFDGTASTWSASAAASKALFVEQPPSGHKPGATGCAGEISVTYNPHFRKWMMTYKCPLTGTSGRGPAPDGVVVLRTATDPFDRWSSAIPLYVPRKDGFPTDGDPAYGDFVHQENLRVYWDGSRYQRLAAHPPQSDHDDPAIGNEPPLWSLGCATSFPALCPPPDHNNGNDPVYGCCTRSDVCCDSMFDRMDIFLNDNGLHDTKGSNTAGSIYAPYIVQPWSQPDATTGNPPTKQTIFYVASTSNPYTVVLMSNELTDNDLDNDGVDEAHDNCPGVYNPGQQNCNRDAEEAWNARHVGDPDHQVKKLGDACDPVPCPTASADLVVQTTVTYGGSGCSSSAFLPRVCAGREIRERIDVAPVGASPTTELMLASPTGLPKNITVSNVDTHTRFCQDNPPDFNCWDQSKMGENQLVQYSSASAERLDENFIWHRVQLHGYCPPNQPGCIGATIPRDDWFTMSYGPEARKYVWDFADDSAFWTAGAKIPANPSTACADTQLYGNGTCLRGRLWTHGVTDVGKNGYFGNDYAGGVHVGWHGEELSNHFFGAEPDMPFFLTKGGMQARPIFFLRLTLPDPWPVWRFATETVIPIVNEDGQWSAVFQNGRREGLSGAMTTAAQSELAVTTFTWLSAEEASPFAGNPSRPLGVAVRSYSSGLELRQTLIDTGGVLDAGGPPQTMSGGDGAPSARTDYAAVYSRARGRVFVAGGHDASTGATLHDLWSFELDRGYWKKVPRIDVELFDVLAMTFSYRDGSVWLVDRDARDAQAVSTRLLRVEPETGSWEIVYATAPSAQATRYDAMRSLWVDVDGNVVLTVSNTTPQRHRVARIAPRAGGYDVSATRCRQRALMTPALADLRGYALFFKQDAELDTACTEGSQPPLGGPMERLEALPLESATLSDLEDMLR